VKITRPVTRVTLSGPLDYDPELRFTPGGHPVAALVLVADDGSQRFVEAWNAVAEDMAEKLVRGSYVSVAGRWKTREWVNRQTGEVCSREIFVADSYTMEPAF
jgi:single-stranded DNA-binding protein